MSISCNNEKPEVWAEPNRICNGDDVEFRFSGPDKFRVRVYEGTEKIYDSEEKVKSDKFTIESISESIDYQVKLNDEDKESYRGLLNDADADIRFINDNEDVISINAAHLKGSCEIETTKSICVEEKTDNGTKPVIPGQKVSNCAKYACERKITYSVKGLEWKQPANIVYSESVYLYEVLNTSRYPLTVETSNSKTIVDSGDNLILDTQEPLGQYKLFYEESKSTIKQLSGTGDCSTNGEQAKNCVGEYDKLLQREEIQLTLKCVE